MSESDKIIVRNVSVKTPVCLTDHDFDIIIAARKRQDEDHSERIKNSSGSYVDHNYYIEYINICGEDLYLYANNIDESADDRWVAYRGKHYHVGCPWIWEKGEKISRTDEIVFCKFMQKLLIEGLIGEVIYDSFVYYDIQTGYIKIKSISDLKGEGTVDQMSFKRKYMD